MVTSFANCGDKNSNLSIFELMRIFLRFVLEFLDLPVTRILSATLSQFGIVLTGFVFFSKSPQSKNRKTSPSRLACSWRSASASFWRKRAARTGRIASSWGTRNLSLIVTPTDKRRVWIVENGGFFCRESRMQEMATPLEKLAQEKLDRAADDELLFFFFSLERFKKTWIRGQPVQEEKLFSAAVKSSQITSKNPVECGTSSAKSPIKQF